MNYKKFFDLAKEKGIEASEISVSKTKSTSVSLFHSEIDSFSISDQSSVKARGIINGKFGVAATERLDSGAFPFLIDSIIESAKLIEKEEIAEIFKGSEKYHKKNVFSKELSAIPVDEKIDVLRKIEETAYKRSELVKEVQVEFEEEESEEVLSNSYGLSLKNKANFFYYVVNVILNDGNETKTEFDIHFGNKFNEFDAVAFANETVDRALKKFGGVSIKPKAYKCVLNPSTIADFLKAMVNAGFSSDNIQKKSSVLVGKLNEKIFSNKVTIEESPLTPNAFFRYFDDEGVATYNKTLVKKGIIETFLYNLETAKKEGIQSTGNGYNQGQKVGISTTNLRLKPGKISEEELIAKVRNGIYVTGVSGLHSGLNANSGDFSLEAEGFLIEDGKVTKPLSVITIGGNIYTLFNEIQAVASNSKLKVSGVETPSVLVKSLKVSSL